MALSQGASLSRAVHSTVEREIKLTINGRFRLPHFPGRPLPRRLLTSTYYDTTRYDLAHANITLRHRREHGTYKWQLKLPLIRDRQEIEITDRRTVPPTLFQELLMLHLEQRPLIPVAILQTRRTGMRVQAGDIPLADVTIDHVAVERNGEVIRHFRELEIEQLNGEDVALRDIERQLRRAGADDHDGRPKLFHALSLAGPDPDARPGPDAPVIVHVTAAFARHVQWLTAHDPGARIGRDPESLHQMRVAARQLRAVLHAAAPLFVREWVDSLQEELAWLSRVLGPARDLDVQIAYIHQEAMTFGARDRTPLMRFTAHLVSEREKAQQALLSELKSPRYLDLIRRLRAAAQHPAVVPSTVTLRDLAAREFKKLRKSIRRAGAAPDSATVHDIRIKTKRARYVADLAEPMIGKPAARFIKQARVVQDILGMHQDALLAEAHVQAFLKHSTGVRAAFVAGRMVERQQARRKQARTEMRKLWKRLLKRGKQAWG